MGHGAFPDCFSTFGGDNVKTEEYDPDAAAKVMVINNPKYDYFGASGSVNEIREEFSAWTKHVTVKAEDDSEPVFVRARAFADESVDLLILSEDGSWTDGGDGWWYCRMVLSAGESTAELLVKVVKLPVGAVAGTDFNVIVVYECSRALFKADGTPYADWTAQSEKGGAQ